MRRWYRRASLVGRAAVALAVQLGVLVASSAINVVLGLVVGAVVAVVLAIVLLPALSGGLRSTATDLLWLVVLLVGLVAAVLGLLSVYHGYRSFREGIFRSAYPPKPMFDDLRVPRTAARLPALAGAPEPDVLFYPTDEPLCMTIRRDGEPTLVVSPELPEGLTDGELEAIVAHEIAHLANADHRLLRLVIAPLFAVPERDDLGVREVLNPFVLSLELSIRLAWFGGQFAVGLFSRGREYAADRAAAELTGDPAALASALETISDATAGPPDEDLREHAHVVDATSVYPTIAPAENDGAGVLATHPQTVERIERLCRLAGERSSR